MSDFTSLIATAVAAAQNRAELQASRARIVAAADEARRRIQRDLHDGAQQHIVALVLRLRQTADEPGNSEALTAELSHLAEEAADVVKELRELAYGIHPVTLARGGLGPALRALARRSALPVNFRINFDCRLPEAIEVNAYYVISEAVTNATKHARASSIDAHVELCSDRLLVQVTDDGIGGADEAHGAGLIGLRDRIETLSGAFGVSSPVGAGTTLRCELPLTLTPQTAVTKSIAGCISPGED